MAKLKAPLFSLGAVGQIGKAIVYFGWKGLDCVREYVIPANPQTAPQQTQRGYVSDAVAEWHGAAYTAPDQTGWNRLAGTFEKIMSGFNAMVRSFVNEAILGNTWERIYNTFTDSVVADKFKVHCYKASGGNAPTVHWGTRKTFFPNSASLADLGGDHWMYEIPSLIASTLYYFWVDVGTSGTDYGRTGIYQQRTTA